MPYETVLDRRNRALVAFTILTGIRDRAIASLALNHVDTMRSPPVVRQDPNSVETKFAKAIVTYFFPVGDDLAEIVTAWIDELRREHLFGPTDPLFPRTLIGLAGYGTFAPAGIEREFWSNASPIREIFRKAFTRAGLPYFPPHSFRHTLGHLAQTMCRTPEDLKAWSQNLGHENISTTLTSYGRIDPHRQGEVIGRMAGGHGINADILAEIGAVLSRSKGAAPG
jgi:integrase